MAKMYVRVACSKGQRMPRIESDKSIALQSGFKSYIFIPKKFCKIYELPIEQMPLRWAIDIPKWLIEKNEELKQTIELINYENEDRYF